jgi:exopolyphosphatase/guanosine-5'-triphosphate,3'-diphosphate pyrophosphatase
MSEIETKKTERLAAIDVGTNSIRCIIVETDGEKRFKVLDDEKATVRLGEGLAASGSISPAAWIRAREAMLRMRKIIDGLGVIAIEAVATSAVRKADNGQEFIDEMKKKAGIEIRVIDGEEEAELAALSVWHHFDMGNSRYAMLDIGGGSIELISATGTHIEDIISLELGAVFLSETFLPKDPISEGQYKKLRKYIRKTVRKAFADKEFGFQTLIGSGGTITSIGSMIMNRRKEVYDSLQGYEILHSEVVHLLAMLSRTSYEERRHISGLSPERADIIVGGVAAVESVMRHFDTNILRINERGIREGLIIKSLLKHGMLESGELPTWRTSIESLAASCHTDRAHCEQVSRFALEIFDALAGEYGFEERHRQILEGAAMLHDIGYFISYNKHHKHSYHLIRYANLFDFTPREKELMANIARYHRKALPKQRHENFSRLSEKDQLLTRRLGGILRLADGLDRRRSQRVRSMDCELGNSQLRVFLYGDDDLSVELYGGRSKGDLFTQAFNLDLYLAKRIDLKKSRASKAS